MDSRYYVILFKSVNHTMWGEKILKNKAVPHKLIPVPKNISSDCGVCLRVSEDDLAAAENALYGVVEYASVEPL